MPSPFPGMDPYLEDPARWQDLHNTLITLVRNDLNKALKGRYVARSTERVVVESPYAKDRSIVPDVMVISRRPRVTKAAIAEHETPVWVQATEVVSREWGLEIREIHGNRIVTTIEILSPTNKTSAGMGRDQYLRKQQEVLESDVNLVEIDLLRGGRWTVAVPEAHARRAGALDYVVSVSRAENRSGFEVYPIALADRLPRIAIPLAGKDPDAVADLQSLVTRCYDSGQYGEVFDYTASPVPRLRADQASWARRVLRRAGRGR